MEYCTELYTGEFNEYFDLKQKKQTKIRGRSWVGAAKTYELLQLHVVYVVQSCQVQVTIIYSGFLSTSDFLLTNYSWMGLLLIHTQAWHFMFLEDILIYLWLQTLTNTKFSKHTSDLCCCWGWMESFYVGYNLYIFLSCLLFVLFDLIQFFGAC